MSGAFSRLFEMPLPPGTQLNGIYEIDHRIGSGGMGEIYKGHTIATGDIVAIKMMRPELAENPSAFALFRREASALHQLHHDAIVRYYVFTIEPTLQRPYLTMEFVDGVSLSELLKRGRLEYEPARTLLQRIAVGLQAAHERGVVHRDVSPENIIIPADDLARAKIIDFGIARSTRSDADGTIIGSGFAGKYSYVSPEQLGLFGGQVTPKSDIYSLGLVMAEVLTGRPIDMSGSQLDIIEKRRKVPDLGTIDPRFRPLLERMLQPDPTDRPDSMAAIAAWPIGASKDPAASKSAAEAQRPPLKRTAAQVKPIHSKLLAWVGALAVVLSAAAAGGFYYIGQIGRLSSLESPPNPSPPPKREREDRVRRYIEGFNGGDCFFAVPVAIGDNAAVIEGFADSPGPFESFDADFRRINGFEASVGVRQVTHAQCPAVAFLDRTRNEHARPPHLLIENTNLRAGDTLSGSIEGYGDRLVELLQVSEDGLVDNLTAHLRSGAGAKPFAIAMPSWHGGAGAQPQLLIAVTSVKELDSLRPKHPTSASELFPLVLGEATRTDQVLGVTARYLKIDK
jgi:serine/threonine protein kinase